MEQLRRGILDLQQFVDALPGALQVIALVLVGMIPFLEGDVAATIGVVAGLHWLPSILLGVIGTVAVTFGVLAVTERFGERQQSRWENHTVMRRVERWGAPVAMLITGFLLSVPMTAFVMRAAGLRRPIILVSAIAVAVLNATIAGLIAAGMLHWIVGS